MAHCFWWETIYLQYVNLTTYETNLQVFEFSISVTNIKVMIQLTKREEYYKSECDIAKKLIISCHPTEPISDSSEYHEKRSEHLRVIIAQGPLATPRRITNTKSYKQNFRATHSDPFPFLVFAWMSWMSSCWEWSIKYHTAFIHA